MSISSLELQIQTLPDNPGVYQYYDKDGKILYVGKAKNLKKRVSSYFNKVHDTAKTNVLVKKIVTIKHIVVPTETDALLLENNLIKTLQPRYNILLRDDKTYPWICIKKEPFSRLFPTRKMVKDGSEYFGPYTSFKTVSVILDLIKELYPLRSCNFDLSQKNIENYKFKVCLEYHIGNCKGACEGLETLENYQTQINAIREILKGNFKDSMKDFKKVMTNLAQNMHFEEAQKIKEKIEILENYQSRSTIINPKITNIDVFSIVSDEAAAFINFLQISHGSIIRSHTLEIKKKLDETDQELLELAIVELRERFQLLSREIIVPFEVEVGENIKVTVPQLGDKKQILELSVRNAKFYRIEQLKQLQIVDPERHVNRIMAQMKKDLRLSVEPRHIECFDNSNIQGTNPVAACVVFKDGKPSKKDYRHFNIKTVEGPNDFASMEEVVYRRYKRLLDENQPLPNLIIIDGGKGQLSSALKIIDELDLRGKIAIIGIAKRLEELFYPGDSIPLYLDKKSETLKIIQQLRNEAHRFGITFHRDKRSKAALNSSIETIPGIGEKTMLTLIKHFKSVKRLKLAKEKEISDLIGISKAKKITDFYSKLDN
ncbi:excinuclease ABC subunit UvrC [Flavobacterium psychrophilum]|uniref:UvrABC system protein C n=2 Tax=Flavobacterium psychrophilum TaxID=96345 RepID=UVRC_FLAPJ|nr:excinuclease ABC subunit UvrC [Flavobacterium psychrophilum]A6GW65.1 RecName: Full=UvrABC system protein C; Short=Protein UvrC; AltName: Full=Excinuclease ABC subunit C [Flavobacterium psychrophilum JIP02/86]AIG29150.1 excinuclease ABC subunit C [Flavobacterium psychrophilum]AIG31427.1 excinuclease ABC subunit C [Flavobacterium psychrophilum]AIG33584.1 excinuclease ABC subunit C [Flavobacterium psychrophilum]AIG35951.1 excinuclease ABC subunit C [Flavobacterium psychrophilum]AIG38207.1 exc